MRTWSLKDAEIWNSKRWGKRRFFAYCWDVPCSCWQPRVVAWSLNDGEAGWWNICNTSLAEWQGVRKLEVIHLIVLNCVKLGLLNIFFPTKLCHSNLANHEAWLWRDSNWELWRIGMLLDSPGPPRFFNGKDVLLGRMQLHLTEWNGMPSGV